MNKYVRSGEFLGPIVDQDLRLPIHELRNAPLNPIVRRRERIFAIVVALAFVGLGVAGISSFMNLAQDAFPGYMSFLLHTHG